MTSLGGFLLFFCGENFLVFLFKFFSHFPLLFFIWGGGGGGGGKGQESEQEVLLVWLNHQENLAKLPRQTFYYNFCPHTFKENIKDCIAWNTLCCEFVSLALSSSSIT